jgi:hypothetical protein
MPNYQNSKIYRLFSPSKDLVYYGSTTEPLTTRLSKHIYTYNNKEKYKGTRDASTIIECLDYKIELVKDFPCDNKKQLLKEEGTYMRNNKCINRLIAGRTPAEYRADNADKLKEYRKNYRQKEKEKKTTPTP